MTSAAYAYSPFAVPPAITALIVMVFGLGVVIRHFSRVSIAMFWMCTLAATWQLAFMMMYLASEPRGALFWARAGFGCVPFLAPAVYGFVVEILDLSSRRRIATALGWLVAAQFGILTLATDFLVTGVREFAWGYYPVYRSTASVPYLLFFFGLLAAGMVEIRRTYPGLRGVERRRARRFTIALGIGYLACVDYLAVYGIGVYPFGWVALLGFVGVGGSAVARYGLVPITPSLAANQIIGAMRDVLFVSDREGLIRFANNAAFALLGRGSEEVLARPLADFIVPSDDTSSALRGRSVRDAECSFLTKGGETVELTVSYSPIILHGQRAGAVVIGRDLRERKRYERETRRAVTVLQSTLESTADGILVFGGEGKFLSWNQRFTDLWRIPPELMSETPDRELLAHLADQLIDPAEFISNLDTVHAHPEAESFHLLEFKDGRRFEHYSIGRYVDDWALRVWSFRDVTARMGAEEALRDSEARYRLLFEHNAAGVCLTTVSGRIVDCNATFAQMLGYSVAEVRSLEMGELFERRGALQEILDRLDRTPTLKGVEVDLRRKDGATVSTLENVARLGRGERALIHTTAVDISDRKRAEEQIEFHAYHDVLTQLPNRRLFADRLEVSIHAAKRTRKNVAVLFIDLDRFKTLNDTLGHSLADGLLLETADRLRRSVRKSDTVARFGGDEFAVILPDLSRPEDAAQVAEKILEAIVEPMYAGPTAVDLSASIGVAIYPYDGEDFDTLLRHADDAMYRAKESGRNTYQLCTEELKNRAAERSSLQARLRAAITGGELFLLYQPQVSVTSGLTVGAEALVRWRDPELGIIEPKAFIPAAEDSRLILPLGEFVLYEACRQLRRWLDQGNRTRMAVNLSARQLHQQDLVQLVQRVVADCGIEATSVELEITETAAMQDVALTVDVLTQLRELGVSIAIDDFGSGYSSLGYLQQLPIDAVKIDQRFVGGARSPGDAAIVTAIINVARTLQLRVVAEGVETSEQFEFLRSCQCHEAQGYLFSPPVDAEAFARFVAAGEPFLHSPQPPRPAVTIGIARP
jgi:diguanylate cyclase (GGDEF)-like protein/PAS domain S-box-containing protein